MGRRSRATGLPVAGGLAVLAASAAVATAAAPARTPPSPPSPPLVVAGLAGGPGLGVAALSPAQAAAAGRYVPGSSVLRRPDGRYVTGPGARPGPYDLLASAERSAASDPGLVRAAVVADRAWLASGRVPGRPGEERRAAERALLDLRLLQRPDGAVVAGQRRHWDYTWPRDASFAAVALARTGHPEDALRSLDWLAAVQEPDGTWAARYRPEDGQPVPDGRPYQLDANGWFPWAVWSWADSLGGADDLDADGRAALLRLWPAVTAAADAAAGSLDERGLPRATRDWWELPVDDVTVSTSGALRSGLRAAAALADGLGRPDEAQRWAAAAVRLDAGVRERFGGTGYRRTPDAGSGADAGMAVLAPPFAPPDPGVAAALDDTERRLAAPGGGLLPGEAFSGPRLSWVPAAGQVMLARAASGDARGAQRWVDWLLAARTVLGALPEKVDAAGRPAEVAPLAWADALYLLTLVARDEGVPAPPVPRGPAPSAQAAEQVGGDGAGVAAP
ncbi:glycoside hydrolase family 15 [Vallicoccus soli]|uniref:Glycoside hydrolase family 15 n=1 Tax=Vallicoccus soli TaxID=2339232 RepID=A0A3A3YV78_9ACTN|nr:glycoside hydrolase family 15 [Vallicoccus soli]RJK92948.1 glycoside hydrolase family 15 [Vallicoccus soli]